MAKRMRHPLPRPLPATARKWKFAGHFLPTSASHRPAPRCTARPSAAQGQPRVQAGGAAARRRAALLKFRFRSLAVISRPRALRQACVSCDALHYFRAARSISLAWPRDGKAPPASVKRRRLAGAACPASACAPGNPCASKMLCAYYATTTRALPAGTCTESASSNGKEEFSLISNPAVELAPGLNARGIRIYGLRKGTIWRSRLAAAVVGEGIWRKIWTGRLRVLRSALRRRRSVAGAHGQDACRRFRIAVRAPSACPALVPARRLRPHPSPQLVPLTHRRTASHPLRRYPNQKLFPTGLGKFSSRCFFFK